MTEQESHLVDESLWVVFQVDGSPDQSFEFPPHRERAVTVGSAKTASLRIAELVPIAFFIDREGAEIWITPAYASEDFRIDTQRFEGRRRIFGTALVETDEVGLVLRVSDVPPTLREDGPRLREDLNVDEAFAEFDPGRETAETTEVSRSAVLAMAPVDFELPLGSAESDFQGSIRHTQRIFQPAAAEPLPTKTEPLDGAAIRRILETQPKPPRPSPVVRSPCLELPAQKSSGPDDKPTAEPPLNSAIQPQPTIEIPPLRFDVTSAQTQNKTVPWQPGGDTTEYERPLLRSEKPQSIATKSSCPTKAPKNEQMRTTTSTERPVVGRSRPNSKIPWLARLGTLTRQRPLVVAGGAAACALVAAVFLVGVVQLVGSKSHQGLAAPTPTVTAALLIKSGEKAQNTPPLASNSPTPSTAAKIQIAPNTEVDDPLIAAAVGHLIAGRLADAEQAYRDLASKYPAVPAYCTVAQILTRRNSADCRSPNDPKHLCPTVKP